jgi:[1-hydroxy-2-(trimethylamino)ethyl]phosphonate dioxygenase
MSVADEVFAIFEARGTQAYFGERVSMSEHMLQAAFFAQQVSAPPALVVAALLHDVGHLIEADVPGNIADWHHDARHEELGAHWLAARFHPEIAEPVRLHVPAKRYLCATDSSYAALLSEASVVTLRLQGGPMSPAESLQFETERFCQEAVQVRRCDDQGKVCGLKIPGLAAYRQLIEQFALREPGSG